MLSLFTKFSNPIMRKILTITFITALFISCSSDNPFSITTDGVGPFSKESTLVEAETIFKNDSVVNRGNVVEVYDKKGSKLLIINGKEEDKAGIIRIVDSRYTTSKGISNASTFGDIAKAYTIKRIDNLVGTIIVRVNESEAYFTFDKKHLPSEFRFDTSKKIEATQIPDDAPIKYFMLGW